MAKEEATLLLKIKTQGKKLLDRVVITLSDVAGAAKFVGKSLLSLAEKFTELAFRASAVEDVRRSFTNLAASQGKDAAAMLRQMKDLSKGTIDELTLMKQANSALLLGLPVEKFGDMLNIARSSAKATGQSMEFMLQSIVTGLGRGSKLVLDNLGIVFDINKAYEEYARVLGKTANKLTDAEKKQAFINKALEIGNKNVEKAGGVALSLGERWEQTKVRVLDFTTAIVGKFVPAMSTVLGLFNKLIGAGEKEVSQAAKLQNELKNLQDRRRDAAVEEKKFAEAKKGWKSASDDAAKLSNKREIKAIDERIVKIQDELGVVIDAETKKQSKLAEMGAKKEAEDKAIAQRKIDSDLTTKQSELEKELLHQEALAILKADGTLLRIDNEIFLEEDRIKKLELLKQKEKLIEEQHDKIKKDRATKFYEFEQFLNSEKVKGATKTLGFISSLQSSKSKELVAVGKLAAIANITVQTASAAMDGYKWGMALGGPILAGTFSGLAIAAGGIQAGKVAGVALAHGGIVKATEGGTQATIGEAGQDEAVIPLEEGGQQFGNNITFNVGAMLGNEDEAREYALFLDSELMKLRQNNESQSFESGIV